MKAFSAACIAAIVLAAIGVMKLPDNFPMPTNSFVIFAALCLFILGGIAFAKFMQRREKAKTRGD